MARGYQITAVATMTGLSVDTIRAWERRYGLVQPTRDAGGIRQYSDEEVTRLGLARAATRLGNPVRHVATLSNDELRALVARAPVLDQGLSPAQAAVDAALRAIQRYDVAEAERVLRSAAILIEPRRFVLDYLAPLLRSVGEQWQTGGLSIAQEHLTSQLVRGVVGAVTGPIAPSNSDALLFATPPDEPHEFGILLAAALASCVARRSYVLGSRVPAVEVAQSARALRPAAVVIGATLCGQESTLATYVGEIVRALPERTQVWVGGNGGREWATQTAMERVQFVPTLEDFDRRLTVRP